MLVGPSRSLLMLFIRRLRLTLAAALLSLVTCPMATAQPAFAGSAGQGYFVGPGDVLSVTVFDQTDLSGKFTVGPDGSFAFPLIGRIDAAGRTPRELEELLKARLADGYLRNPQLSVEVVEFHSQRVFVMGAVQRPGPVPLTGSLTLLEAITAAGGVATSAGDEVVLVRAPAGTRAPGPALASQAADAATIRFSLREIENGTVRENVSLADGDTIFVQRADVVFVLGEVRNPGQVPYSRDLTVLRAISLAGGATPLGAVGRARILRVVDGVQREIKAKTTDLLQPGDTLTVPTRLF